jgi:hypothetical protein
MLSEPVVLSLCLQMCAMYCPFSSLSPFLNISLLVMASSLPVANGD